MTQLKQVYKCNICGNIVEVLHTGNGTLVCCGEPMELLEEKNKDEGQEKHVPVLQKEGDKIKITVGKTPHPMETGHFIEWIEIITDKNVYRQFLKPGDAPEAEFSTKEKIIKVRAFCNIHGLWSN